MSLWTRRQWLLGTGALFAWAYLPRRARAEGRDPRFLTIVLRGALDGLAVAAPVSDPDWPALRGDNALRLDGPKPALALDGAFALNPAMANLHRLYQAGQAIIIHAVATPYRERSHFDGQDVLDSGMPEPGAAESGWLNRAMAALEPGERAGGRRQVFAVGPLTPLIARGLAPVLSWMPPRLAPVSDETTLRLLELYRHSDLELARVLEERIGMASMAGADAQPDAVAGPVIQAGGIDQIRAYFAEAAGAAGRFLANAEGPRLGAIALDGWDTHVNEGIASGRLANLLGALDGAIAAIETAMGAAWRETVVALVTEFGRTARLNGNGGTDHGIATVALLVGGALRGGRVIADWPGVKEEALYEKRDLRPTADLRAVLMGVLSEHVRVEERALAASIFPGSDKVQPMTGLVG